MRTPASPSGDFRAKTYLPNRRGRAPDNRWGCEPPACKAFGASISFIGTWNGPAFGGVGHRHLDLYRFPFRGYWRRFSGFYPIFFQACGRDV